MSMHIIEWRRKKYTEVVISAFCLLLLSTCTQVTQFNFHFVKTSYSQLPSAFYLNILHLSQTLPSLQIGHLICQLQVK